MSLSFHRSLVSHRFQESQCFAECRQQILYQQIIFRGMIVMQLKKRFQNPFKMRSIDKQVRQHQELQKYKQTSLISKVDNTIHWINHYPVDTNVCFLHTSPLDGDLSSGQRYLVFEEQGGTCRLTQTGKLISIGNVVKQQIHAFSGAPSSYDELEKFGEHKTNVIGTLQTTREP